MKKDKSKNSKWDIEKIGKKYNERMNLNNERKYCMKERKKKKNVRKLNNIREKWKVKKNKEKWRKESK